MGSEVPSKLQQLLFYLSHSVAHTIGKNKSPLCLLTHILSHCCTQLLHSCSIHRETEALIWSTASLTLFTRYPTFQFIPEQNCRLQILE